MKFTKLTNIKTFILFLLGVAILAACNSGKMEGTILVTEIPATSSFNSSPWSQPAGEARIVAVSPENGKATNLTGDFYSAISPEVSYDGQNMMFAAKKAADDHWQIWEMKLASGKARQLTSCETDCTNPSYLPIGRFGFTKLLKGEKVPDCNKIFTANLDGSNTQQVSFSPQTFAELTMLKDGRFIAMEKQVFPEEGEQKIMVMRPDGTKLEFFYKSEEGSYVQSKIVETDSEEIIFVENSETGSDIVSLSYNLPLHSHKVLTNDVEGEFNSVETDKDGKLLTTFRKSDSDNFSLYEFDPASGSFSELHKREGYQVVDAVLVKAVQRPRNLPSEVQLQEPAGLLMCQDINFTGIESIEAGPDQLKAAKVEIMGIDSVLGIVEVEEDGSFYIKVEADQPFRIQTLSADNEVLRGPGSWYYLRPNERRACVGCHTGPEVAPFNRQPLSVLKDPVIIKNSSVKLNQNMEDYEH